MSSDREDLEKLLGAPIREPVLLHSGKVRCPVCGRQTLELKEYLYEVPYFGRIIISSGKCSNCGFQYRDVRLAETTKPKKIIVRVKGEKELRYLLVKSAYAYLYIPEVGYEMIPGPASTGFISTVEGVLHRFREALDIACKNGGVECEKHYRWIDEAIDGKRPFTLVICDYEGASKVIGESVVEMDLDRECLEKKPDWLDSVGI